jgi:hypothetical protein
MNLLTALLAPPAYILAATMSLLQFQGSQAHTHCMHDLPCSHPVPGVLHTHTVVPKHQGGRRHAHVELSMHY